MSQLFIFILLIYYNLPGNLFTVQCYELSSLFIPIFVLTILLYFPFPRLTFYKQRDKLRSLYKFFLEGHRMLVEMSAK